MGKYYKLKSPAPWGDYGSVLVCGLTSHLGRKDGLIQYERTGPFMPPICIASGAIIVPEVEKEWLLQKFAAQLQYQAVVKAKIVNYSWQDWNWNHSEPAQYPKGGEPGGYIFSRRHDAASSDAMGELFEVLTTRIVTESAIEAPDSEIGYRRVVVVEGPDHVIGSGGARGSLFCREDCRDALAERYGEWLEFVEHDAVDSLAGHKVLSFDEIWELDFAARKKNKRW